MLRVGRITQVEEAWPALKSRHSALCGPRMSIYQGATALEQVVLMGIVGGSGARGNLQLAIEGSGRAVDGARTDIPTGSPNS